MTLDRNDLIGAWRLHAYILVDADGNQSRPYREDSTGLLVYTGDGFMSVITVQIDAATGTARNVAYSGPFDLYDDRVVHHIEVSIDDGLVGRDNVRFPALDGDLLTLAARPAMLGGEGSEARIVWRRAERG